MRNSHLSAIFAAFRLMLPAEQRMTIILLIVATISGLIQTVGVVSIMPFIAVVSDPQVVESNRYIIAIRKVFKVEDYQSTLYLFASLTFVSLFLSNAVSVLNYTLSLKFFNQLSCRLSTELLDIYLKQNIGGFLKQRSSLLAKNIYSEVDRVVVGTLMAVIEIVSDLVTILAILALLFSISSGIALLSILVLGIAYYFIHHTFSQSIVDLGEEFSKYETDIFASVSQTLALFREIKITDTKKYFVSRYHKPAKERAKISTRYFALSIIPANILEVVAFTTILIVATYYSLQTAATGGAIVLITVFTFAAYRLLPLLYSISDQLKEILYGGIVLKKLLSDWEQDSPETEINRQNSSAPSFTEVIQLNDLSYSYENSEKILFEHFSEQIPKGSMTCIRGRSGIGKSTLIDLILGLRQPATGSILIDDTPLCDTNRKAWQSKLGYVPQKIQVLEGTIAENIAFGIEASEINYSQVARAAEIACIARHIDENLEDGYHTHIGDGGIAMSGGEVQRIGIARALYHDPELLVFDESTNELDLETEEQLLDNLLAMQSATLVIVSHKTSIFERADKLIHIQ